MCLPLRKYRKQGAENRDYAMEENKWNWERKLNHFACRRA